MKKVWKLGFGCCLALYMSSGVFAQYEFTVEGPDSFAGSAGSEHTAAYTVNLAHTGTEGTGTQGWSYGLEVVGGTVDPDSVALGADAQANLDPNGPFNITLAIDPDLNEGKQGVTSAVVLSTVGGDQVLPPSTTWSILDLSATFTVPEGGGMGALRFVDGLIGLGQPVDIAITEADSTFTTEDKEVALVEEQTCCGAQFTVGFSTERLMNTTPGEGIVDDTDTCNAAGSMEVSGPTTVFANVASNSVEGEEVQGWSLSVEVTGDLDITDVTTENTSGANVPDGRRDMGFDITVLADPDSPENAGRRGATSAVVLTTSPLVEGAMLPAVATESMVAMSVEPLDPAAETATGDIFFGEPLVGIGNPVDNVLTVGGGGGDVCNWGTARLTLTIAPPAGVGPFLPGDANNDAKVDIADPVHTLNALFREGPAAPCEIAADSNGDRVVDSADAIYTINYQFLSGPAPADGSDCVTVEADAAGDLTCEDSACEA